MTLVTVTGNVWTGGRQVIPAFRRPELFFRPEEPMMHAGLIPGTEVQATLSATTGAFTVQLESAADVEWTPVLRWLQNPSEPDPEKWAFQYEEWPSFFAGSGGDISALGPFIGLHGFKFGFGDPPAHYDRVIYLDIRGPKIRVHGPAGGNV